jgi:hypothetical protein
VLAPALVAVVVLGGCRQVFGIDDTSVALVDARGDGAPDAHHGSCGLLAADDALRLCLELETTDGDITPDESGYGNDATTSGVTPALRPAAGEHGVTVGPRSSIHVAESPSLDLAGPLTMEMWIAPAGPPPAGRRMSLLDNDQQYGMHLTPALTVRCTIVVPQPGAGVDSDLARPVAITEWTHVACVVAANGTLSIYLDGAEAGTADAPGAISTTSGLGVQIGQNMLADGTTDAPFVGSLDDVRVWAAALTPAELCTVAGPFTGTACPP